MITDEEIYIRDSYGSCKNDNCNCLKTGWLGILCPNWQPLDVKSMEEYTQYLQKKKESEK